MKCYFLANVKYDFHYIRKQLTNTIKHNENIIEFELSVFENKLFIYIYMYKLVLSND